MATFTEQSHLAMPPPGWLHVNGVSLSNEVPQLASDQRTRHSSSPVPMNAVPFSTNMNERQYHKLENIDLPKKLFIDRQIQKAKALPGLLKGTALSHQSSLHSAPYFNPTTNNNQDESLPRSAHQHTEELLPIYQRTTNETRGLRVSFSDFNKVQFIEGTNELSQLSRQHRHRRRSSKKSTPMIANNQISPPSIQHSQSLYAPYCPLSRQNPLERELNIRKQHLIPSPRGHSSRIAYLPDILNQTLPPDNFIQEKYTLQREKSFLQFPEPAAELPVNSSAEMSRESTRGGGSRPLAMPDYSDHKDAGINSFLNSTSMPSSLTSRQRPTLRSISLRQQFTSLNKSKAINFANNCQTTTTNSRRSASLKHGITRNHSLDEEQGNTHNQHLLSTLENRPVTGISPSKHLKRNYVIHFNSKNPFNGTPGIDSSPMKGNTHESSEERFQNLLKIVRPPYIIGTYPDSTLQATATNHTNGSLHSSRNASEHASQDYHLSGNTIFV